MKRMMIATLVALMAIPTFAQYRRYAPVRPARPATYGTSYHRSFTDNYYGLRLGLAVSTVSSDDRYLNGGTAKSGLNAGVVAGFQLTHHSPVYLETGLSYTEKGGRGKFGGQVFSYDLNYLEVPLLMKYMVDVDNLVTVQPFFGVYGAAGVSGRIKDFIQREAYSSFDNDGFKRLDAGLRLGCGVQYDHLYAELGYDFGLSNISHDYFDTSHTGCFFANIGVNF